MKTNQKGFTLIELMIVVAIVGILASVGLPAYQGYTSSSKLSACLTEISGAKSGVASIFYRDGSASNNNINASTLNLNASACDGGNITVANTATTTVITGPVNGVATFPGETLSVIITRVHTQGTWACTVDATTATAAVLNASGILPNDCDGA